MIMDVILRYGAYFKGINVISELPTVLFVESLSSLDIKRRRGRAFFI